LNRSEGSNPSSSGARYYDNQLSMWLSVDPLAMYGDNVTRSPYNFTDNNPVMLIDPDGQNTWKPDANGDLIAEPGDNAQTLADYQGISYSDALKQMKDQGYTTTRKGNLDVLNLKVGDKVEMDNVYTQSIDNSTGSFSTDVMMGIAQPPAGKTGPGYTQGTPEDDYNCWGSAISGSQGNTIDNTVGIPRGNTFDSELTSNYSPTTLSNAEFGQTVLRFADGNNNVQHGAVYYGQSQDGTIYVYTKNGWHAKPEVMRLLDLQSKIPQYGTIQGVNSGNSGYYSPVKP